LLTLLSFVLPHQYIIVLSDKRKTSRLSIIPRLTTPPRTGTQSAGDVNFQSSNRPEKTSPKVFVEDNPTFQGQSETKASPNIRPSTVSSSMRSHLAKSINTQGDLGASSSKLHLSTSPSCEKCKLAVLNPREGGQFISIPGIDENASPQIYHPECFKCAICHKPLNEPRKNQVTFVNCDNGPCHAQVSDSVLLQKVLFLTEWPTQSLF